MIKKGSFLLLFFFATAPLYAQQIIGAYIPKNRIEKHFDKNGDGVLDSIESAYLRTYQDFKWKIPRNKIQKKFDENGDLMLSPLEWDFYLQAKQKRKNPEHK
ncbi:MAG: hypothetical protein ACD_73C00256G0001 [uncultured bacterium]|nr:MAG: hypothetical protein ACD_73C00256G0001 [uncultured bacterium]